MSSTISSSPPSVIKNYILPACVTNNTTLPVVSPTIPSSSPCVTNNATLRRVSLTIPLSRPCVTNNTTLPACVTNNAILPTVCHQQYHPPRHVSPTIPPSPRWVTNNITIDVKCAICWIVDVNFIENAMFLCHKGKAVQFDIYIVGIYRDLKHFVQWLLPSLWLVDLVIYLFVCVLGLLKIYFIGPNSRFLTFGRFLYHLLLHLQLFQISCTNFVSFFYNISFQIKWKMKIQQNNSK